MEGVCHRENFLDSTLVIIGCFLHLVHILQLFAAVLAIILSTQLFNLLSIMVWVCFK
jgi:hypothetical protein